jgi:hypothetical protein
MPISGLKRVAIAEESTWSTAPTAYSSYVAIPAEEVAFAPEYELLARPTQSNSFGVKYTGQLGGKGGQLTFRIPVPALTTAAASGDAATIASWFSRTMKACGFTETLGTGTAVSGGSSTTTAVDVTSAAGIAAGSVVRISGACRLVTASNTASTPDQITVAPALSGGPADTTVVYSGASYVSTGAEPAASFSLVLEQDGTYYVASGCNGVVTMPEADARGRLTLAVTISVNTWSRDVSGFTGSFPALTVPTGLNMLGSPMHWGSATPRGIGVFGFDPQRTIVPLPTTSDANGRGAWRYTDETARATFRAYRSTDGSDALQTDFETPTTRTLVMQMGGDSAAGSNFVVACQVAQIAAYPAETDANGILTLPITAEAKVPSTSGLKPFSLAIL